MIYELPLNIHFPNTVTRSVPLGDSQWGDGEMGKWGISAKTPKPQNPKTLTP
ncbi:hypothetical protein N0824_03339 [Microcystis sp. 0824]|uniref:hypothetical protein n=1 Tax=Microcystis sp. 0824 TaxID=1502726 RepID=UPI000D0C10D0|nr:hypothetical protein [Microcystis sp. 0824]GBF55459.1 hypothetical protein N0824_03339 [Microcystis sp. 0824]